MSRMPPYKKAPVRRTLRGALPFTLAAMFACGASAAPALGSGNTTSVQQVGAVQYVIGKSWLYRADGSRERARVGSVIGVNDRIETGTNGHVHIRFIDNANLSVRPSSVLEILRYEYSPEAPADSVVKLNLIEGVTRAISGEAAEAARDKFRLNTPIAAIGVRGTDFAVSVTPGDVKAIVNQGAIVVAPFSNACLAEAFGPCNQGALELAGGSSQILQISANMQAPTLLSPLATDIHEDMIGEPTVIALAPGSGKIESEEGGNGDLYTDSVGSRAVNRTIAARLRESTVSDYTPLLSLTSAAATSSQLVWGRYAEGRASVDRITLDRATASAAREVTVGNFTHALFRTELSGKKVVQPGLGVVAFDLSSAQAFYNSAAGSMPMAVRGGDLSIDFNRNRYSTQLQLEHQATGDVRFSDGGSINSAGYFYSRNPGQIMAGAVSLDGVEAGYFFEKTLPTGSIEGLTLWGRKP